MDTLLTKWGIEVQLAKNIEQAKQYSSVFLPHILVVDYQLGQGPNGLQVIEQLREQSASMLPACLLTAHKGDELLKACAEQGVNYLPKPIQAAKLRTLLQSMSKFIRREKSN